MLYRCGVVIDNRNRLFFIIIIIIFFYILAFTNQRVYYRELYIYYIPYRYNI